MRRTACLLLTLCSAAWAWTPAVSEGGGLRLELPEQAPWTTVDTPRAVAVKLTNLSAGPLTGELRLSGIEPWRVAGGAQPFTLAAGGRSSLSFAVTMGAGAYAALYPLHATARLDGGTTVHTVRIVSAEPPAGAAAQPAVIKLTAPGVAPLAKARPRQVVILPPDGPSYALPAGASRDARSAAVWQPGGTADRGGVRPVINCHPPYNGVKGEIAADYEVELPAGQTITFTTGLAIRDSRADEPLSDGVTFKVLVASEDGKFTEVAAKHSLAKQWDELSADLSRFGGRRVTLRLVANPGPKGDTSCDSGYWGNPLLRAGRPPVSEAPEAARRRSEQALLAARAVLAGRPAGEVAAWRLSGAAGDSGVAVVTGPAGLLDARIAFVTAMAAVVFEGFDAEVSSAALRDVLSAPVTVRRSGGGLEVEHPTTYDGRVVNCLARVASTGSGLTVAWSMPGVTRDLRGHPRYTRLNLGASDTDTQRVFFGHGHVLVGSPRFSLPYSGFALTTRYVGVDYAGGLSLVSATDPVPDRFDHDQARRFTSLVAHHDTTFTFVPSARGAFAAARVWRGLANLPMSPGVPQIRGKMCLDQWGGDYARAAEDLRLATAWGLDEAVFVKHVWQRWGYDYRLPDIYPPAGDRAAFDAMAAAAKLKGRLFCPHDNYIDLYPDADVFNYDLVAFSEDGTPRRAWYNKGRDAQSYRWHPSAFLPVLDANLALVKQHIAPTSYFIDVWSAGSPVDLWDRSGRFYPKMDDIAARVEGFDRVRRVLGGPTISEAGHDALIGHLDAAEADHLEASPQGGDMRLRADYRDWERVPWFDMGHHGKFVLLAGGLGGRYQNERPTKEHGYASDDYLSLTVLGGRTPMCDGPFNRRAVVTYYLLQPLCAELENEDLLAHAFDGEGVHRQRVTWSHGAVAVNRGTDDWTVDGRVLPSYGFVAQAGAHRADITRREGQISAWAASPGLLFADARPPDADAARRAEVKAVATGFKDLGQRQFELTMAWTVVRPPAATVRPFVHVCGPAALLPGWQPNSDILFQAGSDLTPERLARPGTLTVRVTGTLPPALKPGMLTVKFGLYEPAHGGERLELDALPLADGRFDGGTVTVTGDGPAAKLSWTAPSQATGTARDNLARKVLDFGPVATNTAFRLAHSGDVWDLTLLPGTRGGEILLRLDRLGAAGRRVMKLARLEVDGREAETLSPRMAGQGLSFTAAPGAFRYRLTLGR